MSETDTIVIKATATSKESPLKKFIFSGLGSLALLLGIVGMFFPVLPTTPFLLLALWFYGKSSPRMHDKILNNRLFGEYLRRYNEGLGIPLTTKVISISFLWFTGLISIFFVIENVYMQIGMGLIMLAVSIHLLRKPTYRGG